MSKDKRNSIDSFSHISLGNSYQVLPSTLPTKIKKHLIANPAAIVNSKILASNSLRVLKPNMQSRNIIS